MYNRSMSYFGTSASNGMNTQNVYTVIFTKESYSNMLMLIRLIQTPDFTELENSLTPETKRPCEEKNTLPE